MKKQTAVDWLVRELDLSNDPITMKTINQANAMFEEQIKSAFNNGMNNSADYFDGVTDEDEQYYQQTFDK